MRVVITGGAGFVGANLAHRLALDGFGVSVVDDLSTGKLENLGGAAIELHEGSILEDGLLLSAFEGADVVFHLAARPSVPRSLEDPEASHEANASGTLRVLCAARDRGVRRVIYASSSSVYGNAGREVRRETHPTSPESPYAVSKLAGEHYCRAFHLCYGLETISLRYFNVFGPMQRSDGGYAAVIPRFTRAALKGETASIFGDGRQTRDFTYIDNVVAANLSAMLAPPSAAGGVFNIGCARETSVMELLMSLEKVTGRRIPYENLAARPGEVTRSVADISRARDVLKYMPEVGVEEGLARTWQWLTEERGR